MLQPNKAFQANTLPPPGGQLHLKWWCSDPQHFKESLCRKYKYTEHLKKKYDQVTFSLVATQVVFLYKTTLIWDGRNHIAVTLLIRKRALVMVNPTYYFVL